MKMKDKILNKLWNNEEFTSYDYYCFSRVIKLLQQYEELGTIEELKDMLSMPNAKFAKKSYYAIALLNSKVLGDNFKLRYINLSKSSKALLNKIIDSHSFSNKEIKYVKRR